MAGEGDKTILPDGETNLDSKTLTFERSLSDGDRDDGAVVETRQPEAAPEPAKTEESEQRPNKAARHADKRKEINEEFRRRRAEVAETATEEIAETRSRVPAESLKTEEKPKPATAEPARTEQPVQPQAKRKLKVNGREVELSDEEVVAHAQRSVAAGDILDQAKRDRAMAEGILETLRATQAGKPAAEEPASEPAKPSKTATKLSDADLAEIVDKIQVGDKAEALAALQKFGATVAEDAVERIVSNLDDKIAEQVHAVSDGRDRVRQTNATLESFANDNPEFRTSKPLQAALAAQAAETMRARMLAIGVREEALDRLQRERNMPEIDAIGFAYRNLEAKGHKLPSRAEILTESADEMRKSGMLPAKAQPKPVNPPANSNFDPAARVERKREIAPQPRRAGALPNSEPQQRSREQAALDAVRQMRAHRRGR